MNLTLPATLAALATLPFLSPQDPAKPPAPAVPAATATWIPGKMDAAMLQKMAWLSGTWVLQEGGKTTEEHRRPLQGTTLVGTSHLFDAKKTHFFEFLRITLERGTIAYIAQPSGVPPTTFPLVQLTDTTMVFENGKHDYPQRIRYEKTAAGMTATISLLDGSKATAYVFKAKG
jgi:hypothetical protein